MLVISPIHGASFFDLAVGSTMMDGGNGAVVLVILEREEVTVALATCKVLGVVCLLRFGS